MSFSVKYSSTFTGGSAPKSDNVNWFSNLRIIKQNLKLKIIYKPRILNEPENKKKRHGVYRFNK